MHNIQWFHHSTLLVQHALLQYRARQNRNENSIPAQPTRTSIITLKTLLSLVYLSVLSCKIYKHNKHPDANLCMQKISSYFALLAFRRAFIHCAHRNVVNIIYAKCIVLQRKELTVDKTSRRNFAIYVSLQHVPICLQCRFYWRDIKANAF